MTAYSELVKKFRAKNSKPNTDWRYESWSNSDVERVGSGGRVFAQQENSRRVEGF